MNVNRRKLASIAMAAASVFAASPAFAWKTVYDPTNHIQNTIAAVKATAQEINQLRQIQIDIKQNLMNFPLIDQISKSEELKMITEGLGAANALHNALTEGRRTVENMQFIYGASSYLNWSDFATSIAMRKNAGEAAAVRLYDSANAAEKQIQKAYEAHKKVMEKMPTISGVTEATQATANSVGVLIQQNQAMLMTMSAQAKDLGEQRQKATLEQEALEKEIKRLGDEAEEAYRRDSSKLGVTQ